MVSYIISPEIKREVEGNSQVRYPVRVGARCIPPEGMIKMGYP
jgi:hypothetical protein